MQFNNLIDLTKHLNSSAGLKTIMSQESVKNALKQAADLLEESIQIYIDDFYLSYFPSTYVRTYNFENSLRITPVTSNGIISSIAVYFDEDLATHPSLWGGEDGYLPFLLNDGWQWKDDTTKIYRLSNYDGFHFLEKGIDLFNSKNKWGFKVTLSKTYKGVTTTREY